MSIPLFSGSGGGGGGGRTGRGGNHVLLRWESTLPGDPTPSPVGEREGGGKGLPDHVIYPLPLPDQSGLVW